MPIIVEPPFQNANAVPTLPLRTLRQKLGQIVGGEQFTVGLVSEVTSNSVFTLPDLADSDSSIGVTRRDQWVRLGGEDRRILTVSTTGIVTVSRSFTTLSVGNEAEVHRYMPTLLDLSINNALRRIKVEALVGYTPTSTTQAYNLSGIPGVVNKNQILNVYVRHLATDEPIPIPWYDIKVIEGNLTLITPFQPGSGNTFWLHVRREEGPLLLDTDTISIPESWVLAGARAELYKLLISKTSSQREVSSYGQKLNLALADFRRESRKNAISFDTPIQSTSPFEGPNAGHY